MPAKCQGTKSILETFKRSRDNDLSGCSRASAASLAAFAVLPTWVMAASPEVGSAPRDKDGLPAPASPQPPVGSAETLPTAPPPRASSLHPEKCSPERCFQHGGTLGPG